MPERSAARSRSRPGVPVHGSLDTLRGRSDHHKMEGLFKAASRAIRQAIEIDSRRQGEIPSTKGVIV